MAKYITSKTTIKELLEEDKDAVINALVKFNSNFSKLKNPVLRNLMARRVTIADACKMTNCNLESFMKVMRGIGFSVGREEAIASVETRSVPAEKKSGKFVELDVRPILAQNQDPLKVILSAINNLKETEGLKLINSFEPVPLIHLLSEKGFTHFVIKPNAETVVTYFNRIKPGPEVKIDSLERDFQASMESFNTTLGHFATDNIKYIDVRDMEMPKPMITILENLGGIKEGEALFIYHKKRPVFLLPELEKRGLKYLFKDIADGNVNMLIFKP
jgi:uncharacterized protein (DUF2249 family)